MTICRYFVQGTCRYGNRCRFEHVYPNNYTYGGTYASGGGGNYGGYRNSGSAGCGINYSNYNFGNSYGSGGVGGGSGGGNDRGGTSILRAKAGNQFQQPSSSLFGQPPASSTPYSQPVNSGFFSSVPDSKSTPAQRDVKELMQLVINEFTMWERSGQWPLSCFSLFKENFPGLIDYSPEEIRWYMYQARANGNLEECQQLIKGIYDKSKLMKDQLTTPSAEVFEILAQLSRGEKVETLTAPSFPDNSSSVFGNAGGGNMQHPPQPATSFTFTLPKENQPTASDQNFSTFGLPQANMFSNAFASPIFSNVTTSGNPNTSVFGGQAPQLPQTFGSPIGNGIMSSNSNTQNVNDSVTYTPMEEVTDEMLNAFNAPVYTMGSVPIKPPPKELCGLRS